MAKFCLVGLEIKREFYDGELNSVTKIASPFTAAVGGMVVPTVFFIALNHKDASALEGGAMPTATDIAFALAVLSLRGKRVPVALSGFLLSLAIVDDVGAILISTAFLVARYPC